MGDFLKPDSEKISISIALALIIVFILNSLPAEVHCESQTNECNYKYGFPFASSYSNQIGKSSSGMLIGGLLLNFAAWLVAAYFASFPVSSLLKK